MLDMDERKPRLVSAAKAFSPEISPLMHLLPRHSKRAKEMSMSIFQ
jgi:hypothetical protein